MRWQSLIVLSLATLTGLVIAWIDAQPNWDDTGITVLIVLSVAALFGFFTSKAIIGVQLKAKYYDVYKQVV